MSDRDIDPASSTQHPTATGEFRAAADISASTAQFRAFAAGSAGDGKRPWAMRTRRRNVAVLAAAVILVAAVLVVIAMMVLGH